MSLEQRVTNSDSLLNNKHTGILVGGNDFTVASLQAYVVKNKQARNTEEDIIVKFANEQYNKLLEKYYEKGNKIIMPNNNNIINIINTLKNHYTQISTKEKKYFNDKLKKTQIENYKKQFDIKVNELLVSYHLGTNTLTDDISSRLMELCREINGIDCAIKFGVPLPIQGEGESQENKTEPIRRRISIHGGKISKSKKTKSKSKKQIKKKQKANLKIK